MKIQNLILKTLTLITLLFVNSCIVVDIKGAGVFRKPIEHDSKHTVAYIDIPSGVYSEKENVSIDNGSKIAFDYIGRCGSRISFSGVMIPIFPWFSFNDCKKNGLFVQNKYYLDSIGVTIQLKYNNQIYDPYYDKIDNGSVKFKITDFKAFKKAPDKTLIIHKKKPDGTIFTKELPFDWKIVTEVSGGL